MSPRRGSTPRLTDRLTVGRNATLTLVVVVVLLGGYCWLSGDRVSYRKLERYREEVKR
jgi:hypothetical protein